MNIEIRKLTPDLAEEYVYFFDITPHDDGIDEHKCYCVTWRSDDSYINNCNHWFPTREERRNRAVQFVKNGSIQGYLAYLEDEIVGWCNTNANCKGAIHYLRSYWPIEEYQADIRVKPVFCFAIAPKVQRMGVATKLLERVCQDATDDGFDYVEAYVNKGIESHDFRGPLAMYEKCGFSKCAERDGKVVVRKLLSKNEI